MPIMQHPHWQYYLSLVDDIDRVSRYVDLTEDNYPTYSTEFTRLLLAAGSEIDVVAKLLCAGIEPNNHAGSIVDYGNILLPAYPEITSVEISIPRCSLSFVPWSDWSNEKRPDWWLNYNNVKHERNIHFKEANLGNVLHAVAGLCVFVCYLYYNDFIADGLSIRRPFIYLDNKKYDSSSSILIAKKTSLPDFANKDEGK